MSTRREGELRGRLCIRPGPISPKASCRTEQHLWPSKRGLRWCGHQAHGGAEEPRSGWQGGSRAPQTMLSVRTRFCNPQPSVHGINVD